MRNCIRYGAGLLLVVAWFLVAAAAQEAHPETRPAESPAKAIDFIDPLYGGKVRQLFDTTGDEHNLYHYRSVFNADNSRFLGIRTPHGTTDYNVTLFGGEGRLQKELFTQAEFDWTLAWDRHEARHFYTRKDGTVYRYDIAASKAEALRTFHKPVIAGPSGLSLNEAGNRILLRMDDQSVRNYRLPTCDDERICKIEIPDGWYANWDKLRFTGWMDYFALTFEEKGPLAKGTRPQRPFTRIYDGATGHVYSTLKDITVGHHDFSADGKLAYVEGFNQGRDLSVHVVNLDGSDNRVVFTAPRSMLRYVRNYHIT